MEYDYTCLNHNSLVSQKKVVTKGLLNKGCLLCPQIIDLAVSPGQKWWPTILEREISWNQRESSTYIHNVRFLAFWGWGVGSIFCQNMWPMSTIAINPSYYGVKQLWKSKFCVANECFWVAWVFPSFHFYLFMVEDLVENHMLS